MNLKELYNKLKIKNITCPVCKEDNIESISINLSNLRNYRYFRCIKPPLLGEDGKFHFYLGHFKENEYLFMNLIDGIEIFYKEFHHYNEFNSLIYINNSDLLRYEFLDGLENNELEMKINFNDDSPYIDNIYLEKIKTAKLFC